MLIERLEQIAAIVVTGGLVAGNFFLFTPWRSGHDPRERDGRTDLSAPKAQDHSHSKNTKNSLHTD